MLIAQSTSPQSPSPKFRLAPEDEAALATWFEACFQLARYNLSLRGEPGYDVRFTLFGFTVDDGTRHRIAELVALYNQIAKAEGAWLSVWLVTKRMPVGNHHSIDLCRCPAEGDVTIRFLRHY